MMPATLFLRIKMVLQVGEKIHKSTSCLPPHGVGQQFNRLFGVLALAPQPLYKTGHGGI
jgi:hypothetical protein